MLQKVPERAFLPLQKTLLCVSIGAAVCVALDTGILTKWALARFRTAASASHDAPKIKSAESLAGLYGGEDLTNSGHQVRRGWAYNATANDPVARSR